MAPGTPVEAMLEDRIESLEAYVGTALGGYPVIQVNNRLAAAEVTHPGRLRSPRDGVGRAGYQRPFGTQDNAPSGR